MTKKTQSRAVRDYRISRALNQIESDILDDYLLCYHKEFNNSKTITNLKGLKGLKFKKKKFGHLKA